MTVVTIVMLEQLHEWGSDDKNSNYKEYNSDENRDSEDDSNEDPDPDVEPGKRAANAKSTAAGS